MSAGMTETDAQAETEEAAAAPQPVTARAVLLGLVLAAINTYWVVLAEVRWGVMDGSCLPLFVTPVFILSIVTAGNLALRRLLPRWAFSQVELLTIYIVVVISETLAGHDFVQNLFGTIGHAHWFATPENQWEDLFHEHLASWLVVSDQSALKSFYEGGVSFLRPDAVGPFLVPLAAWGLVLVALIGAMLCANILLRRHWIEHEKLSYPLVVLPVEMTGSSRPSAPFFRDGLMWGGFALAALVTLVNGLHVLVPAIPVVPFVKLTRPVFTGIPWRALYRFYYGVYPFAIALAFFIPSDLSFSCWFFFLMAQAQLIVAELFGMRQAPPLGLPYIAHQAAGAWLALAVGALLTTRRHVARVWRLVWAFGGEDAPSDAHLYRWASVIMIAAIATLAIVFSFAGMGPLLIAGFLLIFFLLSIAMTRVRAEFGTPHEIYYVNPQRIIVNAVGATSPGASQLTALSATYWFNRCYRCHPMPFQLESLKMAELARIDLRSLLRTIALATVAGILLSYWANLQITFREGAGAKCLAFKSWVGRETYTRLEHWLRTMPGPDYPAAIAMGAGAAVFWGLRLLHFRTMLPLHPAGYALAGSFAMNYFWCSFLVAWLVKVLVLRYWGRTGHRQAIRFFMGMLLGDYVLGSLWGIIGPLWGVRTYKNFI